MSSEIQRCLEVYKAKNEDMSLPTIQQRNVAFEKLILTSDKEGFQKGKFEKPCELSLGDELIVCAFFLIVMGGPLFLVLSFFLLLIVGSWTHLMLHILITTALAFHPLPRLGLGLGLGFGLDSLSC